MMTASCAIISVLCQRIGMFLYEENVSICFLNFLPTLSAKLPPPVASLLSYELGACVSTYTLFNAS